ncbi:MAG: SMI1/KNR4 family protein [Alphaproteobacteria bacterium]|nr:SMI1/KNR4 family protein [Alphaproteobacteria bacterium]MCB9699754.1 SMI1/KNR4 family protein [Alphaproteobacteria bacterium]
MTDALEALRLQMDTLATHDRGRQVFGASAHDWRSEPVAPEVLEALEARLGQPLPASWRSWMETVGAGAGPFYGLLDPTAADPREGVFAGPLAPGDSEEPLPGTLVLTNQGCGYRDLLVLGGPHAGEVFLDLRAAGGPVVPWYGSFEAWLDAWLRHSRSEWACEALEGGVEGVDPAFLERCRQDLVRLLAGSADPLEGQYPLPADRCWEALGALHLRDGAFEDAVTAYEQGALLSSEPEGRRALGRCRVAAARGDHAGRLRAADEGLASEGLWWSTRVALLRHRRFALEGLERWDDALATMERIAEEDDDNLFAIYDVAWIRLVRGEPAIAARWLVDAASRGVSCDEEAPLAERVVQVSAELVRALRGAGEEAAADALVSALGGVA